MFDLKSGDLTAASVMTYSTYCGVPVDADANLKAWLRKFHERPAYRKTWTG